MNLTPRATSIALYEAASYNGLLGSVAPCVVQVTRDCPKVVGSLLIAAFWPTRFVSQNMRDVFLDRLPFPRQTAPCHGKRGRS